MIVTPYKTHKVTVKDTINSILDAYLPQLEENTIVAIASKIVSICQGNIVDSNRDKAELIKEQADWYYEDPNLTKYALVIPTIMHNTLIANAGIDESNVEGGYLLWPTNLEEETQKIWEHLRAKHHRKNIGVLITDSRLTPLTYGITGAGISWCGFSPLQDYRGQEDIFGRKLKMSLKSVLHGLASAAVVVTGEGSEQTPLATITDIPFVTFQDRAPTTEERDNLMIAKEDDIYGKMLTAVEWKQGKKK